ncbi:ABC transporter permease [Leeia sp. TBRC 13508]|uniref:Spermidine/putrescine transport system permease protein PotC n=1 Tax=Leeia speluncae TaxID=2884804 RepID=A0ABS8D5H5_9NEIS|nr:ABC transporter permease [Leeia speluncae]MCB6183253.1 ABC transporter permease [Leeia speluncae]
MISQSNRLWRFKGVGPTAWFALVYLYLPILILIVLSFNANKVATIWSGFSLDWYARVWDNPNILRAAKNSFIVATGATIVSTTFATMAALAMSAGKFRGQSFVNAMLGLPLLAPEIVTAVATLLFFLAIGLELGMLSVLVAHTVFCIPFAYMPIRARLEGMDPRYKEAAADLYATPWITFWRITFPLLMPGIVSGAMLAFIISLDDFVITFFVAGAGATTLPVYIFGMIRMGITPEVNAISAMMLLVSIAFVLLSWLVGKARQ